MLQKIDEDIAVRHDGHDHMGCFTDSVTLAVEAFHELPSPILASCLFHAGELLLQLQQPFTLDQSFKLDVTLFIKKSALSVAQSHRFFPLDNSIAPFPTVRVK